MPLVVMSGLPCSGKTRRVAQLVEYIQTHHHEIQIQVNHIIRTCVCVRRERENAPTRVVQVVSDDFSDAVSKNEVYSSAREEKMMRAALKSSAERYLNTGGYLAFPSLNKARPACTPCKICQLLLPLASSSALAVNYFSIVPDPTRAILYVGFWDKTLLVRVVQYYANPSVCMSWQSMANLSLVTSVYHSQLLCFQSE